MLDPLQLRKDTLLNRDKLSEDEIMSKSLAIQNTILTHEAIVNSQVIFAYVSFRSEVSTLQLIDKLLALGKTVTVPITRVEDKRLDAIEISSRELDLIPGYCDIPEPREEFCKNHLVAPEKIETILLPGSVFDKRGGRFGYGGGYYDRFLQSVPEATRIGLAFDLQIVDEAPLQEHDELLDFVVTETMVVQGER